MVPLIRSAPSKADVELNRIAVKLLEASERHPSTPFARIDFPTELDRQLPVMSTQILSLYGHPAFSQLTAHAKWLLSLLETINFFSLSIHGEQFLVAELASRLYRNRCAGESNPVSRYLQHFIHDENSHTYMMAEFCTRYYGRVMPEAVSRSELPELSPTGTDLLFFARVYVLETLLDFVNRTCMQDDLVDPTARAVHRSHHKDEAQHIAFDRAIIRQLTAQVRAQSSDYEIQVIQPLVMGYADFAFSQLVNPRVYREAGVVDPLRTAKEVQSSRRWCSLRERWRIPLYSFFGEVGLFPRSNVDKAD